ncbi:MAG TPA: RluA family pseudouridine synthase [Vicinamibacteria bacterium]|nr:RluA family pseudouridine synthase [Vicinamibacteria bacterium]
MNQGFTYRERIGPGADGQALLGYLARRYSHSDETTWRARLLRGELDLGSAVARPGDVLRAGQWLVWRRPPWEEPAVPLAWAVLHRDDHLLAVAKPRGLPTVPNGGFLDHTLLRLVRRRFPAAVPLHRLGRGTSGLVLFALTPLARSRVSAAWRTGRIEKAYRALASGVPNRPVFTIDAPIGPVPHPRLGHVFACSTAGKPAVSHVRVLEPRGDTSLLEVSIDTGRPHQIRIHLAWAGHPLMGDPLYGVGGVPLPEPGLPGDAGYRLHAHRLSLDHPATGARLTLECAPPLELQRQGPRYERGA